MVVRLSALRAGRPLPPGNFLVLIFVRGWVDTTDILRLEGLGQLKKSSDLNGNLIHDLPIRSIVPKLTMLSRKLMRILTVLITSLLRKNIFQNMHIIFNANILFQLSSFIYYENIVDTLEFSMNFIIIQKSAQKQCIYVHMHFLLQNWFWL
jgi:hypothetical protein